MQFLKTKGQKPYDKCIICDHLGVCCDGPNFLAMSLERWCEWCRMRKEFLGFTNEYISEQSGVSKVTVTRIMSLHGINDIHLSTMQAITRVLVAGSWGQYPCPLDSVGGSAECAELRSELDKVNDRYHHARASVDHLKSQVSFNEKQLVEKDGQLKEKDVQLKEKDFLIKSIRTISTFLSLMLGVSLVVILSALVIDRQHDHIGYFWINGIENSFGTVLAIIFVFFGVVAVFLLLRLWAISPSKKSKEELSNEVQIL